MTYLFQKFQEKEKKIKFFTCPTVFMCYNSIPGWGSEDSSERGGQVQVGIWLQLIVVPPRFYVGYCPSISEGKVGGSEVGRRFSSHTPTYPSIFNASCIPLHIYSPYVYSYGLPNTTQKVDILDIFHPYRPPSVPSSVYFQICWDFICSFVP